MAKKTVKPDWNSMDSYLIKLELRIKDIELQSKELSNISFRRDTNMTRTVTDLKSQLTYLSEQLKHVNKEVEEFKRDIRIMTKEFKNIGKKDEFQRLQDKVEEWGPDTFITKKELQKELNNLQK